MKTGLRFNFIDEVKRIWRPQGDRVVASVSRSFSAVEGLLFLAIPFSLGTPSNRPRPVLKLSLDCYLIISLPPTCRCRY